MIFLMRSLAVFLILSRERSRNGCEASFDFEDLDFTDVARKAPAADFSVAGVVEIPASAWAGGRLGFPTERLGVVDNPARACKFWCRTEASLLLAGTRCAVECPVSAVALDELPESPDAADGGFFNLAWV